MKIKFIETEKAFLIAPIKTLEQSFGDGGKAMLEIVKEIVSSRKRRGSTMTEKYKKKEANVFNTGAFALYFDGDNT